MAVWEATSVEDTPEEKVEEVKVDIKKLGVETLEMLAWFLAFLAALIYLSYQLVVCSIEYYKYPIKAENKLTRMSSLDFPTVTICNLNRADATKMDNPQAITDIFRVAHGCMWPEIMNLTMEEMKNNETYRPYLEKRFYDVQTQLAWKVEDIFKFCQWNGENIPCEEVLSPEMTMNGFCFKLNGDETKPMTTSRSGLNGGFFAAMKSSVRGHTISDQGSYGYKVLLHHVFDYPDVISYGIMVSPGFSYRISFTAETFKYLPYPYKAQGDIYCSDYPPPTKEKLIRKEVKWERQSITSCMSMRAYNRASKLCGCHMKNCTLYQHLTCFEPKFNEIYDTAAKTDMLGCSIPCTLRSYRPVVSQAAFPSPDVNEMMILWDKNGSANRRAVHLGVSLFFEDLILREQLHEPVYNSLSLMGILGGNMGLLLGASILTVAELLEFIILLLWRLCYNYKNSAPTEPN